MEKNIQGTDTCVCSFNYEREKLEVTSMKRSPRQICPAKPSPACRIVRNSERVFFKPVSVYVCIGRGEGYQQKLIETVLYVWNLAVLGPEYDQNMVLKRKLENQSRIGPIGFFCVVHRPD